MNNTQQAVPRELSPNNIESQMPNQVPNQVPGQMTNNSFGMLTNNNNTPSTFSEEPSKLSTYGKFKNAVSSTSEFVAANPLASAAIVGTGAGIGALGAGALAPLLAKYAITGTASTLLGAGVGGIIGKGVVDQMSSMRERSLFDSPTSAIFSGVGDGEGFNTASSTLAKFKQMYAKLPMHIRPMFKKFLNQQGVPI